jgi:hypothetical protein
MHPPTIQAGPQAASDRVRMMDLRSVTSEARTQAAAIARIGVAVGKPDLAARLIRSGATVEGARQTLQAPASALPAARHPAPSLFGDFNPKSVPTRWDVPPPKPEGTDEEGSPHGGANQAPSFKAGTVASRLDGAPSI